MRGCRSLLVLLGFCATTGLAGHQINPNRVAQLRGTQRTRVLVRLNSSPNAMVFDGANIWVADFVQTLTKVRASDGAVLLSLALPNPNGLLSPEGIVFDGVNIWASMGNSMDMGGDYVAKVRASDGALLGTSCRSLGRRLGI